MEIPVTSEKRSRLTGICDPSCIEIHVCRIGKILPVLRSIYRTTQHVVLQI